MWFEGMKSLDGNSRSRLAECLGVEDGQKFECTMFGIKPAIFSVEDNGDKLRRWSLDGTHHWNETDIFTLINMINHPEEITPRPRWSESEKGWARGGICLGFTHVAKDGDGSVYLYADEPVLEEIHREWIACPDNEDTRTLFMPEDWPNIQPGATVKLEEIKNG